MGWGQLMECLIQTSGHPMKDGAKRLLGSNLKSGPWGAPKLLVFAKISKIIAVRGSINGSTLGAEERKKQDTVWNCQIPL